MPFLFNSVRQALDVAELVCDVFKSTEGKLPPDLVGAIRYMLQQKERRKMVVVAFYDYLSDNCPKALNFFTSEEFTIPEGVVEDREIKGKETKRGATWKKKAEESKQEKV